MPPKPSCQALCPRVFPIFPVGEYACENYFLLSHTRSACAEDLQQSVADSPVRIRYGGINLIANWLQRLSYFFQGSSAEAPIVRSFQHRNYRETEFHCLLRL